ncbi:actin-related protein 2/3 complex subunit 5 [Anastrepha obliqua]|uniref:actin-related protein 2/3 complex subunit 5 n=1 Tax=Anastrepha ludens TaxID=28586 RepID=UPI0023AE7823|nr:actin-related protein 2/3 complex subunit 5 [Anastrepha ludens]XP_053959693.1 actin-related protein 2/3 complex subunit 5 [Anastrepha ludens]XP_053959694.1 actin-related protein 2/3 complex subunit 5 [Anastrepha ludens]XP_054744752.1 actin-related protein 2/3 complex subunit 5 [Anastrepha obliqua]
MAKNTSSSAFRKIDVDQYNEDNFKEDEADAISATVGPDENEITTLLTQGKSVEALVNALQNAPLRCKHQQVKDNALNITLRVLLSIKSSQMDQAVEALEQNDLIDILMKYIYRGFEIPSEGSSGHLLQWHEKAFAKGGVGCIVRVLSDTNRA